ncbi:defensin Tk-AMP-D4-like [Wolffia australiana]|uniref:Defensin-like protein n=1 Tax=Wolffia australiana TaxID=161112 RepID=H6UDU1_WOLAU|nr:defensin-like protein [Wolffia australiana]
MALKRATSVSVVVLVLLVLLTITATQVSGARELEDLVGASARICSARSGKFRGLCLFSINCARTCRLERFTSGRCSFLRCLCTKTC